ncbi:MAG TPA: SpoIIE family protein phosphatase [Acidimicrobiales bacterium]|jgi:sigma-B regulation protein RsbU (phosphoserine phosphatase)|nr:SpoIIE family protein phosphatase [Acidimicrobiales bacterium]
MTDVEELRPANQFRHPNESSRIEAVRRYEILDTPPDGTFDRITALAARILGVPVAIVSIVDTDRIWFKSHHGLVGVDHVGRDPGLCASAILQDGPWIVNDAASDPRTLANPLVAGPSGFRFYAGVPLSTADGFNLGTLCVLDTEPRQITAVDTASLEDLAALVMDDLELRLAARRTVAAHAQLTREAEQIADALQASLLPPKPPTVPGMEIAARFMAGEAGLRVGGDFFDVFRLGANDWGVVLGDACGRGAAPASLAAMARWTIRAAAVHNFRPSDVLRAVNAALVEDSQEDDHFCTVMFARLELDVCGAWITVANAGHPLPVVVRASGHVSPLGPTAFPLGMFTDFEGADERIGLGPGDFIAMYTDGITEARRADGTVFGEERLLALLEGCSGAGHAAEVADEVMAAAPAYAAGDLDDDAAVLVLRVPEDAGADPLARVVAATGVPIDQLALPGYPHGSDSSTGAC